MKYREFPIMSQYLENRLLNTLRQDILERYNNAEYWDGAIIDEFYREHHLTCGICGQPLPDKILLDSHEGYLCPECWEERIF